MIGRTKERQLLQQAFESDYSEFVVVYGRRRVGKTFLIRETFGYGFTFQHSGLANASMSDQLEAWAMSLRDQGLEKAKTPKSWLEAFSQLKDLIRQSKEKKKVVFIDEMPWMDTHRSKFVMALENFWNGFASARKDILLVVCGSATSWIINKIFKNHGGLHNRVTYRIHLQPFTLNECQQYAAELHLDLSRYQLLVGYMVMGGVPFYWSQLQRGLSLDQNIDELFFNKEGILRYEFKELYASLFRHPEAYMRVIAALGQRRCGLTREEILEADREIDDNGKLTTMLEELEQCGFVRRYNAIGKKTKGAVFQLVDNFTLFHFQFIQNNVEDDEHFWTHNLNTPMHNTWCGLAFERLCFNHIRQIKETLGIGGIASNVYAWRGEADEKGGRGAQIDMVIDRADNVINLCEMKFSKREFRIEKSYADELRNKEAVFAESTHSRKALHLTMVTTYGVEHNAYWGDVQKEITADDLFRE